MTDSKNLSKKPFLRKLRFPLLKKKQSYEGRAPKNPKPGSAGGSPIAGF